MFMKLHSSRWMSMLRRVSDTQGALPHTAGKKKEKNSKFLILVKRMNKDPVARRKRHPRKGTRGACPL
jgi:hypothetical protein